VKKDWRNRNLKYYEGQLAEVVPKGSNVLGEVENWYYLYRNGCRLFLLACIYHPGFNLDKIDYLVLPLYYKLLEGSTLDKFIKDRCVKIKEIGTFSYSYLLPDKNLRHSGYASIVYKVKK